MQENKQNRLPISPTFCNRLKKLQKKETLRIKTDHQEMAIDDLIFVSPSEELSSAFRPLLQNRRINFQTKNKKKIVEQKLSNKKSIKPENNIEKLKKQIQQLEKEDFFSYRRKMDEIQIQENKVITKYNEHNSLLMDIRSKQYHVEGNKIKRPKTTLGAFAHFNTTPITNHNSAPRKYYSKAKRNKIHNSSHSVKDTITFNVESQPDGQKKRQQQIFLGMKNMLRGYKRKSKAPSLSSHNSYRI